MITQGSFPSRNARGSEKKRMWIANVPVIIRVQSRMSTSRECFAVFGLPLVNASCQTILTSPNNCDTRSPRTGFSSFSLLYFCPFTDPYTKTGQPPVQRTERNENSFLRKFHSRRSQRRFTIYARLIWHTVARIHTRGKRGRSDEKIRNRREPSSQGYLSIMQASWALMTVISRRSLTNIPACRS